MDKTQKNEIELTIHAAIKNLQQDIIQLAEKTKPISPDVAIGRLTRMEAINEKSINEASLANARKRLIALQSALHRLHDDDFGICEDCDQEIPVGRILLLPESRICVKCAGERP